MDLKIFQLKNAHTEMFNDTFISVFLKYFFIIRFNNFISLILEVVYEPSPIFMVSFDQTT